MVTCSLHERWRLTCEHLPPTSGEALKLESVQHKQEADNVCFQSKPNLTLKESVSGLLSTFPIFTNTPQVVCYCLQPLGVIQTVGNNGKLLGTKHQKVFGAALYMSLRLISP